MVTAPFTICVEYWLPAKVMSLNPNEGSNCGGLGWGGFPLPVDVTADLAAAGCSPCAGLDEMLAVLRGLAAQAR